MRRITRRKLIIASTIPTVLLLAGAAAYLDARPDIVARRLGLFPTRPIPGVQVSASVAERLTGLPVPDLPAVVLTEPCTGRRQPVTRIAVWVATDETSDPQMGVTFSNGIWMSLTPASGYESRVVESGELLPVEEAFSQDDYPHGLTTVKVRGHTAWMKTLAPTVPCDAASVAPVDVGSVFPSATPAPATDVGLSEPMMFAPTINANVTWLERGYVIEVAGPFNHGTISGLAEKMVW